MINACEGYLRGLPMREAMNKAGYNKSYTDGAAHVMRFLMNRHVINYLRKRQAMIAEANTLDKNELVGIARKIANDNKPDRAKGLELLIRLGVPIEPDKVTREDLKAITITFNEATNK